MCYYMYKLTNIIQIASERDSDCDVFLNFFYVEYSESNSSITEKITISENGIEPIISSEWKYMSELI